MALLGFASSLHDESWWRAQWERGLEELRAAGLKVVGEQLIVGGEARPKLPSNVQGVIALVLTGGTSKQVAKALQLLNRPAVLVALPWHNSLASALEARAYLKPHKWLKIVRGAPGWGLKVVEFLKEAADARGRLACKVLALGGMSIDASLERAGPEQLYGRLGIQVVEVASSRLSLALEGVRDSEVEDLLHKLPEPLKHLPRLREPARLYLASKRLVEEEGASGVTFNCFSLLGLTKCTPCLAVSKLIDEGVLAVCEAEAPTLGAAAVVHRLLGLPFFVANIIDVEGAVLKVAHCTAPLSMGIGAVEAMPHFESGLPAGLDVEIARGPVSLLCFNRELEELVVARGVVEASSLRERWACRTQALVRVDCEEFVDEAPGGHLLIVYGDLVGRLQKISEALGVKFRHV